MYGNSSIRIGVQMQQRPGGGSVNLTHQQMSRDAQSRPTYTPPTPRRPGGTLNVTQESLNQWNDWMRNGSKGLSPFDQNKGADEWIRFREHGRTVYMKRGDYDAAYNPDGTSKGRAITQDDIAASQRGEQVRYDGNYGGGQSGGIGVQGGPSNRGGNYQSQGPSPIGVYENYLNNRPQSPMTASQQGSQNGHRGINTRNPYAGTIHDINRSRPPSHYSAGFGSVNRIPTEADRQRAAAYNAHMNQIQYHPYQVYQPSQAPPSTGRAPYQPNPTDWRYIAHSRLAEQNPDLNIRTDVRWSG